MTHPLAHAPSADRPAAERTPVAPTGEPAYARAFTTIELPDEYLVPARVHTDTMIVLAHSIAPTSTRLVAPGPIEPCVRRYEFFRVVRSRPPHPRGSSGLEPHHVCRIPTITASHHPTLRRHHHHRRRRRDPRDNRPGSPAWAAATRAAITDAAAAIPKTVRAIA